MEVLFDAKKLMNEIVTSVDEIIGKINLYVPNRHGSIAITRLEEAVMWINVMVNSYPLKMEVPKNDSEGATCGMENDLPQAA